MEHYSKAPLRSSLTSRVLATAGRTSGPPSFLPFGDREVRAVAAERMTVEAYIGPRSGRDGVNLKEQVLVTEHGPDRRSNAAFDLA